MALLIQCYDPENKKQQYDRLDGIMTAVIARIYKQAEPLILSTIRDDEERLMTKIAINEVRSLVSHKWKIV